MKYLGEKIDNKDIGTKEDLDAKQATLVSGTNIKTVNGNTLLGSGDLPIAGAASSGVLGRVQVSNGDGTFISDANLHWNNVDKRLGIGTATPSEKLDVNGVLKIGSNADRTLLPSVDADYTATYSRFFYKAGTNSNLSCIFSPSGTATLSIFQLNNSSDLNNRGRLQLRIDGDSGNIITDKIGAGSSITSLNFGEVPTANETNFLTNIGFYFNKILKVNIDNSGNVSATKFITSGGTASQFVKGDGVLADFAATVRSTVLTGLSLASSTIIAATDSVLSALGKVQGQITALKGNVLEKNNTTTYSPTLDYHPSTKKYTDDSIRNHKRSKTLVILNPAGNMEITLFYTDVAITFTKLVGAVRGTSPSVTLDMYHAATRNGTPTTLSGSKTFNNLAGTTYTSFTDATIPANRWVYLTVSGITGTVDEFSLGTFYTED